MREGISESESSSSSPDESNRPSDSDVGGFEASELDAR